MLGSVWMVVNDCGIWSESMAWFVVSACSAAADVRWFSVVRVLLCSFGSFGSVWPMYALGHSEQGMW